MEFDQQDKQQHQVSDSLILNNNNLNYQQDYFDLDQLLDRKHLDIKSTEIEGNTIKKTHIFDIKGEIKFLQETKEIDIERRYSDFEFVDIVIRNIFYFKIIPILPEKDFLMNFVNNKKKLQKRIKLLEQYIYIMSQDEQICQQELFYSFLFDTKNFYMLKEKPKFKIIYEQHISYKKKFQNVYKNINELFQSKDPQKQDFGYFKQIFVKYKNLEIFVKALYKQMNIIYKNQMTVFEQTEILNSIFTPDNEQTIKIQEKRSQLNEYKSSQFQKFMQIAVIVQNKIKAVMISFQQKDEIYKQFKQIEKDLQENYYGQSEKQKQKESQYEDFKQKKLKLQSDYHENLKLNYFEIEKITKQLVKQLKPLTIDFLLKLNN